MNKAFVIFVALIVGALAAVYLRGGISTWDPEKKGAEVKAAISPGMTWSQVLDLDEPGKLQTTYKTRKKIAGEEIEVVEFGAVQNFDRAMFESEWKGKSFADGFAFIFAYTQQINFKVYFDGTGKVTGVENVKTMADLLGTRKD